MPLSRRNFLCVGVSTAGAVVAGCMGATEDERIFHEGERLVTVAVAEDVPGDVVVEADCRAEDVTVAPRERVRLRREDDGETCSIRLVAGDEELYALDIRDYEAPELTVGENGDVEELEVER